MTSGPFAATLTVHVSGWAPIAPGFLLRARVVRHRPDVGGQAYVVHFEWATTPVQVDKPYVDLIRLGGDRGLAIRLANATAAGRTHRDPFVKPDLDGFTYVEARRRVWESSLLADLAAVGH